MGESGAEEREIQSGKSRANKNTAGQQNQTHKGMSRRTFMKVVGTGALAIGANRTADAFKGKVDGLLGISGKDQRSGAITTGQLQTDSQKTTEVGEAWVTSPRFEDVFGNLEPKEKGVARSTVDEMKYDVLYPHSSFKDMMAVTNTFQSEITEAANEFKLPSDLVSGMVFIENGGGVARVSPAGAFGPAQLMEDTAREMELRVDSEVDERTDTTKCFMAMSGYLNKQRDFFGGNLGFGIWAYHAGPGNVAWAIQEYLIDTERTDIGSLKDAYEAQDAVAIRKVSGEVFKWTSDPDLKLNVHQVLSNPRVMERVIPALEDETELYVYKAIAGAEVFAEQNTDSGSAQIAQQQ